MLAPGNSASIFLESQWGRRKWHYYLNFPFRTVLTLFANFLYGKMWNTKEEGENCMSNKRSSVHFHVLSKLPICIPIILASTLYYNPRILYIKELSYLRNPHLAYIMFIAFNFIWQATGFRKYFGGYYEIIFNLFPTEVFLMLYFAQRHFRIAVVLVMIAVAFALWVGFENIILEYQCDTKREYKWVKRKNYRRLLLVVSLLYCIPAVLTYFIYDMEGTTSVPSSESTSVDSSDDIKFTESPEELLKKNKVLLQEFEDDTWSANSELKKINLAQKFVDFEAACLEIPTVPVSTRKLDDLTTIAYYSEANKEIVVDAKFLAERTGEEFMNTLCEETYHAMEDYLLTNMDWELPVVNTRYFQELREWKENEEDYIDASATNFEAYETQPIEASAKKYALEEVERIKEYLE